MTLILTAISHDGDRRFQAKWRAIVESVLGDPEVAASRYERDWNIDHPALTCKVIDVRPVHPDRAGTCVQCKKIVALHFDEQNRYVRCSEIRMEETK